MPEKSKPKNAPEGDAEAPGTTPGAKAGGEPSKPGKPAMEYKNALPVLPLRDVVIFPNVVLSLYVGRASSLRALEAAMKEGGQVFVVAQKTAEPEEPTGDDLFSVGCVANVLQMLKLPDDTMKVLVEGARRASAKFRFRDGHPIVAEWTALPMEKPEDGEELTAMCRALHAAVATFAKANRRAGGDLAAKIGNMKDAVKLTDFLSANFPMRVDKQQKLLEISNCKERVDQLLRHIARETEMQKIERKIRGRVKEQVEKNHKEYYLQEQMRAIQKEMGDDHNNEVEDFKKRAKSAGLPEQARKKVDAEIKKLKMMSAMSSESAVTRTYLETLLSLPWKKTSALNTDMNKAEKTLNGDHYGLHKVKERVLEHLAVQKRAGASRKAPILCFVGPPGVGKTSLGRSIAAATGRQYARIALGGVRDEADIRGHRRTYIGAMPGRIINSMARAKVKNPLVLLDEVDKMGMDFRGDPAAALLEVLDPEQNMLFTDHYIDLEYDLSQVMFVTTANSMNIPPALQDRLEVIPLSGYTENEKIHIAANHLLPRQLKDNGLAAKEVVFPPGAVRDIIRYYTREAGVRALERTIGGVCRKAVLNVERKAAKAAQKKTAAAKAGEKTAGEKSAAEKPAQKTKSDKGENKGENKNENKAAEVAPLRVTGKLLEKFLGPRKYRYGIAQQENRIGQVSGLAWTAAGGDLLSVEACKFPGRGKIIRTGKLGEVMRESVVTAFSVVHTRAAEFQIPPNFAKESDFHIHFPEGAIPKDGPSAGIAIATALLSLAAGIAVRVDTAMTGEITLRGEVLPVGGVKEKLLAAVRGDIRQVILPKENEKDLVDIPAEIKNKLKIIPVKWIDEVFHLALESIPAKKPRDAGRDSPPPPPLLTPRPRGGRARLN